MFVYENGKWHAVMRVEEQGRLKFYIASCGHSYPGESNTSDDEAVRESRRFCGNCLMDLYMKETKELKIQG
jgi:hypothetical protein